jgi:protein SCO1/2
MRPVSVALIIAAVAALGVAGSSRAQSPFTGDTPAELEGIEIVDRAGETVPGDIVLRDETGNRVRVGDYLNQGRPVLVQLVYYSCPMLCTLVLNGYVDAAQEIDWVPGQEYEVLSVSFDPADKPELAAKKKANYVKALGREEAAGGWHFLTGEEAEVRRLADAVGFRYRWLEAQKQFSHAAGMFVLTPEGKISRTLYGIDYPVQDLRFSLLEASEGRLGSPLDRLVLYCFQYDPETHKYALVALNVMKLGGVLTVVCLGLLLGFLWIRERRQVPRPAPSYK